MPSNNEDPCRIYRAKMSDGHTIRAIIVPNTQEVFIVVCHCDLTDVERKRLEEIADGITKAWGSSVFNALEYVNCHVIQQSYEMSCILSQALRAFIPLPDKMVEK